MSEVATAGGGTKLKELPLSMIRASPVALRIVDKDTDEYRGLVDSIRIAGVLNSISVRMQKDPDTGATFYVVLDGLHRFTAAGDAGLESIPCRIVTAGEADALKFQLMANLHRVETKHHQYGQQLSRILGFNPTMTQAELAASCGVSPTWIGQRLSLTKLDPKIGKLVDDGAITLSNATVLTKLPIEEQGVFVDRAMTTAPAEFTNTVNTRAKELRDAKRQGREPKPEEFVPMARLRKLAEIKMQAEAPHEITGLIREAGLKTPAEMVKATLDWVLHLDSASVEVARAKDAAAKLEEDDAKEKRKAEQLRKKEAAAAAAQKAVMTA